MAKKKRKNKKSKSVTNKLKKTAAKISLDKQESEDKFPDSGEDSNLKKAPKPKKLSIYRLGRRLTTITMLIIVLCFLAIYFLFAYELRYAGLQSYWLHKAAKRSTFKVVEGKSERIKFPLAGPYDLRAGYSKIPEFTNRLEAANFLLSSQAQISSRHSNLIALGIYPLFREKDQFGLRVYDTNDKRLYRYDTPERIFTSFSQIPPLILNSLLFIEDRNLLSKTADSYNPAVEWDRFGRALMDVAIKIFNSKHHVQGGSTLATQIEKYRHSNGGQTNSLIDKLRQMSSAALRTYRLGKKTKLARQAIARSYINTVPLAAVPGYGEVHGLGDGLWAYYEQDYKDVAELLSKPIAEAGSELLAKQAIAFRQVLGLFIAHRRPSEYLGANLDLLQNKLQTYLDILYENNQIEERLYQAAKDIRTEHRRRAPEKSIQVLDRKAADKIRTELLRVTGASNFYDLDRLDLSVKSTINIEAQMAASKIIAQLKDRKFVSSKNLFAYNMLNPNVDLSKIIYSFTVYEKGEGRNYLRVQTDSSPQPFNLNEGGRLDLGSTSKARTLITYLETIYEIYNKYKEVDTEELKKEAKLAQEELSKWVLSELIKSKDLKEETLLSKAMQRKYSANPRTSFFTAAGKHTFNNFNGAHNGGSYTLADSLRFSINLPFIRLMQDLVRYYSIKANGVLPNEAEKLAEDLQVKFLQEFIQQEGQQFLSKFYRKYKNKNQQEVLNLYLSNSRKTVERLALLFWFLDSKADAEEFKSFILEHDLKLVMSDKKIVSTWERIKDENLPLQDKAYLARLHLSEAYICSNIFKDSEAKLSKILKEDYTQEILKADYYWLLHSKEDHKRHKRINIILEQKAFDLIYLKWKNLGYSMSHLVPSLATALGTSADKPASLAKLMGIVLNDGKLFSNEILSEISFAERTPFFTKFSYQSEPAQQVLPAIIAKTVKKALYRVVSDGTAIRLKKGLKIANNKYLKVAGKTGTGDHRFKEYTSSGALKEARVVNRTATFMFIVDDRFFGTISAFVPGEQAKNYKFTSSLPVALLGTFEEVFTPLVDDIKDKGK